MKLSELKQIIKEEVQNIIYEGVTLTSREKIYISKDAKEVKLANPSDIDVKYFTIYTYKDGDDYLTVAWRGKQKKPYMYYSFGKDKTRRDQFVNDMIINPAREQVNYAKEKSNIKNPYKVGDILYSSWGYDQTNIDYYKVLSVTDKMAKIQQLENKVVGSADAVQGGKVIPGKKTKGSPFRVKMQNHGGETFVKLSSYAMAYLWDGKPKLYSSTH